MTTKSMLLPEYSPFSESSPPGHPSTRSCLLVAATGLGKTAMMAGLANHWPSGRVMLISHRFELNQQARTEFERICRESVDLEQSEYFAGRLGHKRIVIASVQTLNATRGGQYRMKRFKPYDFGLLLIDEAHRAPAVTYRRVINHFRQNPDLCVVGVTATPDRLDRVGLGTIFDTVGANLDLKWGIENGWLCEPRQKFVQVKSLDLSDIRTVAGDFDKKQLAKVVQIEENLHAMASPIVDVCGTDKQAIVFCASVQQAHRLAELLRDYSYQKHGFAAVTASVDGKLSPQHPARQALIRDYREGVIQYLCNMQVATEGFDAPKTSVIAVARPTKSRALYTQMVGRGSRPDAEAIQGLAAAFERRAAIASSSKPNFTVLDFVGNSGRHELICTADLLAGDTDPPEVIERAKKIASNPDFDRSALDALREAREEEERLREARRAKVTVAVQYELRDIGSGIYPRSTYAYTWCPNYMKAKPPTEKQIKMLIRLGYTQAQIDEMNPRSASSAIDYAIRNPRTSFGRWMASKKLED